MQRHTVEEVLERVERRAMPDDENGAVLELPHRIAQPSGHAIDHLSVALTVGEGDVKVTWASFLDLRRRPSGQIAVVAFAKPGIAHNRKRTIAEGDLGGAKRTGEVRAEDSKKLVVAVARAEAASLRLARRRERGIEPAGREAGFVVDACRVSFEDQLQREAPVRELMKIVEPALGLEPRTC